MSNCVIALSGDKAAITDGTVIGWASLSARSDRCVHAGVAENCQRI